MKREGADHVAVALRVSSGSLAGVTECGEKVKKSMVRGATVHSSISAIKGPSAQRVPALGRIVYVITVHRTKESIRVPE